ncbi:hypothetical protein YC2023_040730 [Brassica napus]
MAIILIGPEDLHPSPSPSPRRAGRPDGGGARAHGEPSPLSSCLTHDIMRSYINSSNFVLLAVVGLFPLHHFIYLTFLMGSDPYHLLFTF